MALSKIAGACRRSTAGRKLRRTTGTSSCSSPPPAYSHNTATGQGSFRVGMAVYVALKHKHTAREVALLVRIPANRDNRPTHPVSVGIAVTTDIPGIVVIGFHTCPPRTR